jgi:murein DD-endopeptidase MepM/ murein hydrolase activator NlpD
VLSTSKQLLAASAVAIVGLWTVASTIGMLVAAYAAHANHRQVQSTKAAYARMMATHDAKLIAEIEHLATTKADRLGASLKLVGINPETVKPPSAAVSGGKGGPFISASDPRAVAAMRRVSPAIAGPIVQAAKDVSRMRDLANVSSTLPLFRPTADAGPSSGYGYRRDPFTGRAAFHPGLDFPRPRMTPVFATAPGVVSFTGGKAGYGETVEIDHGQGFKTRFAHLASISVARGQKIGLHQQIGAIGSSGRSTGPHLHYEVWRDGQVQDPERFLKAGENVQQAG